jgi:hypothetical protein
MTYKLIGALFHNDRHFATATVVDSPKGNLILSAAHPFGDGREVTDISFVPNYPVWTEHYQLEGIFRATEWTAGRNIDYDVSFAYTSTNLQAALGAYKLAFNQPQKQGDVLVVGYPDRISKQLSGRNSSAPFGARQMVWNKDGYTAGTSGSPWILLSNEIFGVIGGYQQGGDSPDTSYSPVFHDNILALYNLAKQNA